MTDPKIVPMNISEENQQMLDEVRGFILDTLDESKKRSVLVINLDGEEGAIQAMTFNATTLRAVMMLTHTLSILKDALSEETQSRTLQ